MLQPVPLGHKTLADYTHIVGRPLVDEIRELAEPLKGRRIVHLSATAFGGGVSEILYTLVPLMRDVGLEVRVAGHLRARGVLQRDQAHAQRAAGQPAGPQRGSSGTTWRHYNEMNARELTDGWDVCDRARPAAGRDVLARAGEGTAPGCGAATSTSRRPTRTTIARLLPLHRRLPRARSSTCPSTCPTAMNGRRPHRAAGDRPAHAQEHGALARGQRLRLRAVRHRRRPAADLPGLALRPVEGPARGDRRLPDRQGASVPDVQLALVGSMATDDPEGWDFFNADGRPRRAAIPTSTSSTTSTTSARSRSTPSSRYADVLVQKSTREGFGLTVSEAIWKARPVHRRRRRRASRSRSRTACRASSSTRVERLRRSASLEVLHDPAARQGRSGGAGKEHVRTHFLMPRLLRDWLRIFTDAELTECRDRNSPLVLVSNRGPVTFERRRGCDAAAAGSSRR